jgi:PAS domain S-box-containing protein
MAMAGASTLNLCQILANTADGAFIVDKEQRIIYWNQFAQKILGYTPNEVVGRTCYEILRGQNDKGCETCRCHCHVVLTALAHSPTENFYICVRVKSGKVRWINVSILTCSTFDDDATPMIIHLFRNATQNKQNEQFVRQVLTATKCLSGSPATNNHRPGVGKGHAKGLTDREHEVLNLLVQGLGTRDIAQLLTISPSTARNHIQNILRKLGVHSRLEAVVYTLQHGLVRQEVGNQKVSS